jgi:hypothetical protein
MSISRQIAQSDVLPVSAWPKSVAGKWRTAAAIGTIATGQVPGSNSIRLYPYFISDTLTIDQLALSVSTVSAGGFGQAAIYAADSVSQMPTAAALVSSASISTSTAGAFAGAVTPRQFTPALYWWASNCDNAVAIFLAGSSTATWVGAAIGSATLANAMSATGLVTGFSFPATFGTWPDLTSASLTELNTSQRIPVIGYHAQSVP